MYQDNKMYQDLKGGVIVDTVDHFSTMESYAKNHGVDVEKFQVLRLELSTVRDSLNVGNVFVCKDKSTGEEVEFEFKPQTSVFAEFFKKCKIIVENR